MPRARVPGSEHVTSKIDIYRSAKLMVDQHGNEATIHAAMQADRCLERNDFDGKATWMRVIEAIKKLVNTDKPEAGESVH